MELWQRETEKEEGREGERGKWGRYLELMREALKPVIIQGQSVGNPHLRGWSLRLNMPLLVFLPFHASRLRMHCIFTVV
jgi:hypothetical protein